MVDDALVHSLAARVRELEATQAELRARLEQATSVAGIMAQAGVATGPMPRVPVSHRAPRDRHGLHVVRSVGMGGRLPANVRVFAWPCLAASVS